MGTCCGAVRSNPRHKHQHHKTFGVKGLAGRYQRRPAEQPPDLLGKRMGFARQPIGWR